MAVVDHNEVRDAGCDLGDIFAGRKPVAGGQVLEMAKLRLAPCVPRPGKIICIGLNYRRHAAESGVSVPSKPIIFSKLPNALAAANDDIPLPSVTTKSDYEAELVAVIGRTARNVPDAQALQYVWGFCNGNDLSARDLQV